MLVIATRDMDGYLTIWKERTLLGKMGSRTDYIWVGGISENELACDDVAFGMLGFSFHGIRKGSKKVFNITVKEIK